MTHKMNGRPFTVQRESDTRAGSAVACMHSLKEKMEMYLASGDVADTPPGPMKSKEVTKRMPKALELWQQGYPATACAEAAGISFGAFRKRLRKMGEVPRKNQNHQKPKNQ